MEIDLNNLMNWSNDNNLLFNTGKLQLIIFHSKRLKKQLASDANYLLRCSKKSIEQKDCAKLLGVHFDQHPIMESPYKFHYIINQRVER